MLDEPSDECAGNLHRGELKRVIDLATAFGVFFRGFGKPARRLDDAVHGRRRVEPLVSTS
jgi:hypothetical protein